MTLDVTAWSTVAREAEPRRSAHADNRAASCRSEPQPIAHFSGENIPKPLCYDGRVRRAVWRVYEFRYRHGGSGAAQGAAGFDAFANAC